MSASYLLRGFVVLSVSWAMLLAHTMVRRSPTSGGATKEVFLPNCSVPHCDGDLGEIYCSGRILALAWHFFGSDYRKNCTGTMLKYPAKTVLEKFQNLTEAPDLDEFQKFCLDNFDQEPYLVNTTPVDWVIDPPALHHIRDPKYRAFAKKLNRRWRSLTRKVRDEVKNHKDRYPVIWVPNNFVVPGGAFKLYFYWDSYWITKGLITCAMDKTVRGILENFAHLIKTLGYIPNAGALSISRRSQPPLFTQMVSDYVDYLTDKEDKLEAVNYFLPFIEAEMAWWRRNRSVEVVGHQLFQYRADTNCPRPEAYSKDIADALNSTSPREFVWSSISSACESGWDFSSRWYHRNDSDYSVKPHKLSNSDIITRNIVPVDLNAFMCRNYATIAKFYRMVNNATAAQSYETRLDDMRAAFDVIFWNDDQGVWLDWDVVKRENRRGFYPSNFFAMYGNCSGEMSDSRFRKIVKYINESGAFFVYPGGVPTSLLESGQQWDFPNAWAPLVHLIIEGFRMSDRSYFQQLALKLTQQWVKINYLGFTLGNGTMWEKYNVTSDKGDSGGGGEYKAEEGFGWTNGAVLDLMLKYGDKLSFEDTHLLTAKSGSSGFSVAAALVVVCILVFTGLVILCFSVKQCQTAHNINSITRKAPSRIEVTALLDDRWDSDESS